MMIDYIQFATSILLLIGYSSALPATSNDHKLNRRLLTPGMGLINLDLSDLKILSPESNTFKLNYLAGVGNYYGPNVVYFDPFAKPGQEQSRVNMGPLNPAPSQPQPGQYINTQQAPNQAQGGQQVQPRSQVGNDELKEQPEASDQPQQQSQAPNRIQFGQQPQQQFQAPGQLQPDQQPAAPNQAQLDQSQAPIQSQPDQQPPSPNQAQLDQIQAFAQSQLSQQSPASNQVQPDQNQNRW